MATMRHGLGSLTIFIQARGERKSYKIVVIEKLSGVETVVPVDGFILLFQHRQVGIMI